MQRNDAGDAAHRRVVLRLLLADPYIAPFTAAVDVATFPDYLKIVDHPMDLGTVMDKLKK